jgi:hypothetical protein
VSGVSVRHVSPEHEESGGQAERRRGKQDPSRGALSAHTVIELQVVAN